MNRVTTSVALVVAIASSHAVGQVSVGPLNCVSCGNALENIEVALIASPINSSKVAAAWNTIGNQTGGDQFVWYAASDNGGTTFHAGSQLPRPCSFGVDSSDDPMVAGRVTGTKWDLWLGGRQGATLFMDELPTGSLTVAQSDAVSVTSCSQFYDKPFAAVGPCALCYASDPAMYITSRGNAFQCYRSLGEPLGGSFPTATAINVGVAEGHFPVVLRNQPHTGRVLVAGLNGMGFGHNVTVSLSIDGGATWAAPQSGGTFTVDSDGTIILPVPEDQGNPTVLDAGFPSVATDPGNSETVVVAFPGVPNVEVNRTIDVYVAVSTDGGDSFTLANQPRVFRIPDSTWRLPGEPEEPTQELIPSVAIDSQGGVNLLAIRMASDGLTASVRYARWGSLGSLTSGAAPSVVWRLSQDYQISAIGIGGTSRNDYQMITTSGCYVWCGYAIPSVPGSGGITDVWVQRIDLLAGSCTMAANVADFNRDSTITTDDAVAFTTAYAVGAITADVDRNQTVNAADAVVYLNAYNEASHP
jgi:hypothetical protein